MWHAFQICILGMAAFFVIYFAGFPLALYATTRWFPNEEPRAAALMWPIAMPCLLLFTALRRVFAAPARLFKKAVDRAEKAGERARSTALAKRNARYSARRARELYQREQADLRRRNFGQ